jgi:endo-1,4-beta-xylanase
MERKHFVPNRRVLVAIAAAALVAVGAACTGVNRGDGLSPTNETPTSVLSAATSTPGTGNQIEAGQWSYMPGTKLTSAGLLVEHRGFTIVQQDGSSDQLNPPVNEYGTYFKVPESFAVRAVLADVQGRASLQLYSRPPVVSDEFRVEPKSIRFTIDGNKLTLSRWDGDGQQDLLNQLPAEQKTFDVSSVGDITIDAIHDDGELMLTVDGIPLGTFPSNDTFVNGEVWIGADAEMEQSSFTIKNLQVIGRDGGEVGAIDASKFPAVQKRADGLQELVRQHRKDFKFGTNIATWAMVDVVVRHQLFNGNFETVTPENALKWQFTEPLPGVRDFHQADAIVAEARKNNMQVHGHNLVFSEALPRWVRELPTETPEQKAHVKKILIDHVTALAGHYKGVIDDWDINEIFADYKDDGSFNSIFRNNVFLRAMGPDYVREVIKAAHRANPNVRIWLNDYGMEADTGSRVRASHAFTKSLIGESLPVYGVGRQAHIYDTDTDLIVNSNGQAPELAANLKDLQQRNVKARISELDAPVGTYGRTSQSKQVVGIVKTCLMHPNCVGVGFWSMGPMDVWQDDGVLQSTSVDSLFDHKMKPTQSYTDLQKFLRQYK